MNLLSLGYVGFSVRDITRWNSFATEILGMESQPRAADGPLFLKMDDRHHRIAIDQSGRDDLEFAGWEVAGESQLRAASERLARYGIAFERADATLCHARDVDAMIFVRDPNGIRNEIFWRDSKRATAPYSPPRALTGFRTGEQGLGHIVLAVDDAEATLAFYRDVFGLRVSDYVEFEIAAGRPVQLTFLHCNSRHHSLAFLEMPSAPRRLSHIMFEALSIDDVGSTYALCERDGVPIATTLGRHTNDHMLSFYLVSPSGFNIEFGWGARSIDDATWQVERYTATSTWGHRRLIAPALGKPQESVR